MVTETNDKYPHKPSPKHTLEEVRKSLEDLVRNEFEGVEAPPQPAEAAPAESSSDPPDDDKARRPLSALPRRKPVGLDTTQLLHSLKGLISDELSDGGSAPAQPRRSDDEAGATTAASHESTPDADHLAGADTTTAQAESVIETGAKESGSAQLSASDTAGEGEEITLETADVSSAVPSLEDSDAEGDLEALEKMTESLGKVPRPLTAVADDGGETDKAGTGSEEPAGAMSAPSLASEPATQPWSQLPLLEVIDLPETGRTPQAFAVQDPVFASDPSPGADDETFDAAAHASEAAPMFISQWLDEDPARQAADFQLGLSEEESEAAAVPAAESTLEQASAVDTQASPAGVAKGAAAGEKPTGTDEETKGADPRRESPAHRAHWGEIDVLEVPGGDAVDQDTPETEVVLPAADIDNPEAESRELTLQAPKRPPCLTRPPALTPTSKRISIWPPSPPMKSRQV